MKVLNEEDKGKTITLKVEERLQINLKENASTGFSWLEEITPNQVLSLEKEEFIEEKFTHGGNTIHRWLYKGIEPGRKKLKFVYQRPWIKNKPSEKEFEVNVYVST